MSNTANKDYDVIIIGAGIGGLVCGCYLAKAGMKVLIVEQHHKPGGYCTSFKRNGFTFDAAAHSFGSYREGGSLRRILSGLGIDTLINVKRSDPSNIVITPDFEINLWNDTQRTMFELIKLFPKEERGIRAYFEFLDSADQTEFMKLKDKTFKFLLSSFFADDKLISSITLPIFSCGGVPPSLMNAFLGTKMFSEFLIDGGYYFNEGIQTLPDVLVHTIKQNRGEIIYGRLVRKILCQNGSATGVETDNNETFTSKYVVSACDIRQTFKTLIGKKMLDKELINKLDSMIPSLSFFILYIGVKPFKELPTGGSNIWYLPYYDLDKVYDRITLGHLEDAGMYLVRVSPDRKTIVALFNAPFKTEEFWDKNRKRLSEYLLTSIEKTIPNLRRHVIHLEDATPHTLHRYTLNYKGAAYGWAPLTSQSFDPAFIRKSFIKRLYLTGHWTTLATGVQGVCYTGYDTATHILRQENLL